MHSRLMCVFNKLIYLLLPVWFSYWYSFSFSFPIIF